MYGISLMLTRFFPSAVFILFLLSYTLLFYTWYLQVHLISLAIAYVHRVPYNLQVCESQYVCVYRSFIAIYAYCTCTRVGCFVMWDGFYFHQVYRMTAIPINDITKRPTSNRQHTAHLNILHIPSSYDSCKWKNERTNGRAHAHTTYKPWDTKLN